MAVSGNQTTRIGGYLSGVGKWIALLAKGAAPLVSGYRTSYNNIIRIEEDDYTTLIPDQGYRILIRDSKPGSLYRDGDYGHTSS